jgi:transcriptional regulator with XRE-family HTH domain
MANKKKNYLETTLADLASISTAYNKLMQDSGMSIRGIAQRSGISINSIKSVMEGRTANIATYDEVARAFDTSLIKIIQSLSGVEEATEDLNEAEVPEVEVTTEDNTEEPPAPEVASPTSFQRKNTVL